MTETNGVGPDAVQQTSGEFGGLTPKQAEQFLLRMEALANNASTARQDWLRGVLNPDPRRDVNAECGYPLTGSLTARHYQDLYEREPYAARVVEMFPKECWSVTPIVYEDEDPDVATPFEQAWDGLAKSLRGQHSWFSPAEGEGNPLWEYMLRADVQSRIGSYGIILLGIDDGMDLSLPAKWYGNQEGTKGSTSVLGGVPTGVDARYTGGWDVVVGTLSLREPSANVVPSMGTIDGVADGQATDGQDVEEQPAQPQEQEQQVGPTSRRLLYMRVFPEALAQVTALESDPRSPRYGQPTKYLVEFNNPDETRHTGVGATTATREVHWTRVVHVADNLGSSEVFGVPAMRPVLNNLLNIVKVNGASPEGYWRSCFTAYSFETHPALGGNVKVDQTKLRDMWERFTNGLDRGLFTSGMAVKTLAPSVADPKPHVDAQVEAICVSQGFPKRIFLGSERGELASGQDDDKWNERVAHRHQFHLTPHLIIPLVDRLICLGVLPPPAEEEGYKVWWPDVGNASDSERASVGLQLTQALTAWIAAGGENVVPLVEYLTVFLRFPDDVAQAIAEAAAATQEQAASQSASLPASQAATAGQEGQAQPASQEQPGQPNQQPTEQPTAEGGASADQAVPGQG